MFKFIGKFTILKYAYHFHDSSLVREKVIDDNTDIATEIIAQNIDLYLTIASYLKNMLLNLNLEYHNYICTYYNICT